MNLKVLLPTEILVDEEVSKVTAEASNGSFTLLPRHIDFVAELVPGLLSYETDNGNEVFVAIDEGVLVKVASEVFVSTLNGVTGKDLGQLRETVEEKFENLSEKERAVRTALAKLESDLVRRFVEIG